ncbi:hypothetical protein DMUE_1343 [Dictyocoela muelleri]|nr:hypothetical protein DMUE_1343 [Dictyocoela muelleri]
MLVYIELHKLKAVIETDAYNNYIYRSIVIKLNLNSSERQSEQSVELADRKTIQINEQIEPNFTLLGNNNNNNNIYMNKLQILERPIDLIILGMLYLMKRRSNKSWKGYIKT